MLLSVNPLNSGFPRKWGGKSKLLSSFIFLIKFTFSPDYEVILEVVGKENINNTFWKIEIALPFSLALLGV